MLIPEQNLRIQNIISDIISAVETQGLLYEINFITTVGYESIHFDTENGICE